MEDNTKKLNRSISARILYLMAQKGITPYRVMKNCGIPSGSFYKMMNSDSEWRIEWLLKIADYLKVSMDYLTKEPKSDEYGDHPLPNEDIVTLQKRLDLNEEFIQKTAKVVADYEKAKLKIRQKTITEKK
jgi:hypothetical protein